MNAALTTLPAWQVLVAHHDMMRDVHLRQLFADDPTRGERLSFDAEGILVDSSNNRITDETLSLLLQLAVECGLRQRIDAMFRGEAEFQDKLLSAMRFEFGGHHEKKAGK